MLKRLTYANVVATIALVFAMTGGAMAASHYLINSTKQINPKVLKKLKGATGKTGPAGAAGREGAPGKEGAAGTAGVEGKAGPSEAITARVESEIEFSPTAGNAIELLHVKLNAGAYTLSATMTAHNSTGETATTECTLRVAGTILDRTVADVEKGGNGSLALSGTVALPAAAEVKLICKSTTHIGGFESTTLTATRVGSLG